MNDEQRQQIALFRYGLIAPLVSGTVASQKEYLEKICAQVHEVPFYGRKEYAPKTLLGWLRKYRRHGFSALKPKPRTDQGASRQIPDEIAGKVIELRKEHMQLSVKLFYRWLIDQGHILPRDFSYTTLYRFFKNRDLLTPKVIDPHERKRFAHQEVNVLWQTDVSHGPWLRIGGKKQKSYLIAFIDDASRRITAARFMPSEKFADLKVVLKQALLSCGKPRILYADNGKIFRCDQLQITCADLGIALVHTRP